MDEDIIEKAEAYVARRDCRLAGRLGFGIHDAADAIEGNAHPGVNWNDLHHKLLHQVPFDFLPEIETSKVLDP